MVATDVVAGVVVAVAAWAAYRRLRRHEGGASHTRSGRRRTLPFLHHRRARHPRIGEIHGRARLVFVQVQGDFIVIDGLIATTTDGVLQPFWLQVRRPDAAGTSTSLESLMSTWAADGSTVEIETKPSRDGCQATLSAGHSRMVLELEAVGGVADAA
jgi:hypothetical protein